MAGSVSYSVVSESDCSVPELTGSGSPGSAGLQRRRGWWLGRDVSRGRFRGAIRSRSTLALVAGLLVVVLVEYLLLLRASTFDWSAWRFLVSLGVSLPGGLVFLGLIEWYSPLKITLWLAAWLVGISSVACGVAGALAELGGGSTVDYVGWRLVLTTGVPVVIRVATGLKIPARSRQLGVAVYATGQEDVFGVRQKVGNHLDHVHVDLVDETVNAAAVAVNLGRLDDVRRCWPGLPVCLHVMSHRPRSWVERTWSRVDWYLLPCDSRDDLSALIADCRRRGKQVGIVWRQGFSVERMQPYLSQVDFVMVMGIARLGVSGQTLDEGSLEAAQIFSRLSHEHHYQLMFDGGVNVENAARIPGRYLVSASGVLASSAPKCSAELLRWSPVPSTGGRRTA